MDKANVKSIEDSDDMRRMKLARMTERLSVDFDAVQVIASRYDKKTDTTEFVTCHHGNIYTRMGMVYEWLQAHEPEMDDEEDDESGETVRS